ncbi:MAG TPA: DNA gyrase subunit B, partial [Rhodopila sp.]|nr:DNA gyrase subunit B [Rhodopila sp.]
RLTYANGEVYQGDELRREVILLREASLNLKRLSLSIPVAYLEQAAIAGVLTPDPARAMAAAPAFAARLNAVSLPTEQGWVVSADHGLTLSRTVRGVAERYTLDASALRSAEARWLAERTNAFAERFNEPAKLKLDSQEPAVVGPATAYDRIIAHGRRGLSVQRFKGLGEMNPDQLWQTTLDPAVRTLLQVKVGDSEDAAQVFSTLMGDVVEPRREFIVGNALKVANLDV